MTDSRPYNTGNDEWILEKLKEDNLQLLGSQFTATELKRSLYLAAEGAVYLSPAEIRAIDRRITRLDEESRRMAVRAAKTKN